MNAKVTNLTSPRTGNPVANQFEITTDKYYIFQSYETIIAKIQRGFQGKTILDENALDYSKTTLKYLKQFLGTDKSKRELEKDIEQGIYKTANLNK